MSCVIEGAYGPCCPQNGSPLEKCSAGTLAPTSASGTRTAPPGTSTDDVPELRGASSVFIRPQGLSNGLSR